LGSAGATGRFQAAGFGMFARTPWNVATGKPAPPPQLSRPPVAYPDSAKFVATPGSMPPVQPSIVGRPVTGSKSGNPTLSMIAMSASLDRG
jgi:hypothetical protein